MNERADMENFDWVRARSACSASRIFETLRLQVEADVEARRSTRPKNEPFGFSVHAGSNSFVVLREGNNIRERVTFTLTDKIILVRDTEDKTMFEVEFTLNENGECRPKIHGQEREFWQLRMMALEKIFFGTKGFGWPTKTESTLTAD